ncbi:MAG: hypothetical protein CMF96_08775 [Candidatus Marinimicrobia bacterium]|nr:hypothetical protein [Candidatus Neomarinimicrobiota bacterium]|tara:strand:+ start:354 stop:1409 length:1056 start_codon:yes stop_codon:yes gene_type:complete
MSIGIDLGLSTVKIVEIIKNEDKYYVEKAGIINLMPSIEKYNPEKINKSHWVSAIQDLSRDLKIQPKKAKVITSNISSKDVSARQITMLEMSNEELESTLELEAKKYIQLDGSDPVVDFHIIGQSPTELDKINLLYFATTKNIVNKHHEIIKESGFKTGQFNTDSIGLINSYLRQNQLPDSGVDVIINIGSSSTQLIIWGKNHPFYVREIEISGYHFIKYIAEKKQLSLEEAEKYLKEKGVQNSSEESTLKDEDSNSIKIEEKTIFDNLTDEIRKTLRYYMKNNNQAFFNKFLVSGGSSKTPHLSDYIAGELKITLSEFNPFENMELKSEINSKSQYAVAVGLAIAGLEQN